ncbi:hypothetical protein GCM10010297_24800 [Streptomyces malachitofuscus]|nr:hypothetical protein GCM10010297_24800 [Streptomyces malachitofuscus]
MSTPPAAAVHRTRDAAAPEPSSDELDALLHELSAQPPGLRRAALRDQVIRRLLPMARRVTRRFQRHGEEFDDLLQVACLGLIKAVDGYDPALGHAFLSYALPKVTGELRRHLRDRTATVRLPRPFQEASGRILQAVGELEQRLGGSAPTTDQIAAHTGLGRDRVLSTLRAVHACRPRSLDEPSGHGQESSLACLIGAEDPALERVVDTVALAALVKQLPERDRRVLHLRFYRERTQQQIADAIGVSQMQVSRILRRCLDRLRGALLAGEPGEGSGDGVPGPVTGRTVRPARPACARRVAAEPHGPERSTGRAPCANSARPPGPAPRPAVDTVPRAPDAPGLRPPAAGAGCRVRRGGGRPMRRWPVRMRWPGPSSCRRWWSCAGGAPRLPRACTPAHHSTRRPCRPARPPPGTAHTKKKHLSRPGLSRLPPRA